MPTAGSVLHLRLHDHRRDLRLDHRLGPDPGVRARRRGGRARLVGLPAGAVRPARPRCSVRRPAVNVGAVLIVAGARRRGRRRHPRVARVTNALVVIKVAVCLFVIVVGLFFVKAANLAAVHPAGRPARAEGHQRPHAAALAGADRRRSRRAFGVAGVLVAAAVVFFAYSGFEAVANLGEETENPARDMPLRAARHPGHLHRALHAASAWCSPAWSATPTSTRARRSPTRSTRSGWAGPACSSHRRGRGPELGDPGRHRRHGPDRLRAGPRRPAAAVVRRKVHPQFGTPCRITGVTTAVVVRARRRSSRWARWPRWSASARCSRSSWSRSRCRCCAARAPDMQRPFRTPLGPGAADRLRRCPASR